MIWSFALTIVGVTGWWLVGRKKTVGWLIGVITQVLWFIYAIITVQWGFMLGAVLYGGVSLRTWLSWRRADRRMGNDEDLCVSRR